MIDNGWRLGPVRAVALVLGVVWTLAAGGAAAQIADVFEVRGVNVDVTAKTAAAAREQALVEGERAAFERLMQRLTLSTDQEKLPKPSRDDLAAVVKDFAVAEEKTSAVRYLASLDYRFKAKEIRQLLKFNDLAFAETVSKPVLVLPVFEAAGAPVLWDDPNPWREAWMARPPQDGLVPLILPLGDLADISGIDAIQAVNGDFARLGAMAQRYGAGETLVARAVRKTESETGRPAVDLFVARFGSAPEPGTTALTFVATAEEGIEELLVRAAIGLTQEVEEAWKQDNLLQFGQEAVLAVTIPISGLRAWLEVRKRLTGVTVVRRTELVLLSRDEVRVNLHHIGDLSQLGVALRQADLALSQEGDVWTLQPAMASSPGES
jgi:hypothetical protein